MRNGWFGIWLAVLSGPALASQDKPSSAETPPAPMITNPDWKRLPDLPRLMEVYPRRALRLSVTGKTSMQCRVTRHGDLKDCHTVSEDPPGFGFGPAELAIADYFKLTPMIIEGKPVEAEVVVPMRFDLK